MCKKAGDWTTKLSNLAKRIEYGENGGQVPAVRVLIEGPYGNYLHVPLLYHLLLSITFRQLTPDADLFFVNVISRWLRTYFVR